MNKTTLKALTAFALIFVIIYWGYQYYHNKVILNNYNLMIVILLVYASLKMDNEKKQFMKKYKISSSKIEHLFEFMNFFKLNEIIRYKYFLENNEGEAIHVLVFDFGLITNRQFLSKVNKFKSVYGDVLQILEIDTRRFNDEY